MNNLKLALQQAEKIEQMLIDSFGEITAEIEAELALNPATLTEMIDSKYMSLERLDVSTEFYEKKADEFKKIALSLKNAKAFIQDSIKQYMIENQKSELAGSEYKFKLSHGKPKVNILDEEKIESVYKKTKTETTIDKTMIYEDLKNGLPVEGAILEESYTLRKSINKGK